MKKKLNTKIESYIKEMPSLPVSTGKVMEICNNPSASPKDLNHVISLDPVLTGRLLQLINSAYYGFNNHITSLIKAITMLGLNTVKNLTLSTAILSTLPKNKKLHGLDMEGFWRHCLCVGVTSKLIAVKQGVDPKYQQEYFTTGLLHDIGKVPLNAMVSIDYMNVISSADNDHKALVTAEDENFGINHCSSGELITQSWKLESPVSDVIIWHHNIDNYYGQYLHILYNVMAADYFSIIYDIGFSGNKNPVKPDNEIWKIIGLNENSFEEIKEKVFKEIEKAQIFLKV
jgi:HD-like signal output (HDOD) protein